MRISPLFAVAVAAIALTGCETKIDDSKAEKTIRDNIISQIGTDVASVECPADLTAKKGGTFECTVTGEDGSTGVTSVTMTDDEGNVRFRAPFISPDAFNENIATNLAREVGVDPSAVTVDCPDIITAEKGGKLQCAGTGNGDPIKIDVTQTDDKGSIDFEVVE